MRDLRAGLLHYGAGADHIHTEVFGAGESSTSGLIHDDHPAPRSLDVGAGDFSVAFARSGVRAGWNDSYRSLLEVAEACDVPVRRVRRITEEFASCRASRTRGRGRRHWRECQVLRSLDFPVGRFAHVRTCVTRSVEPACGGAVPAKLWLH
jgi:hypothetical protein